MRHLLLFGVYSLWKNPNRRAIVPLFLSPLVLALIASGLHKYPFLGRTIIFSNPLLTTFIAAGVAAVWEVRHPTVKVFAAIMVGMLLLYPIYLDAKYTTDLSGRLLLDMEPTLA